MHIEITGQTEEDIHKLIASGAFSSPNEVVQAGVARLTQPEPTPESFIAKLTEAHQSAQAGELETLDTDDIKREVRERLTQEKSS